MMDKGFLNVSYFIFEYIVDVVWVLVRTVLSPIFLIGWFVVEDRPITEYEWWPK